ncbi:MAG: Flp pilus assembly protein CpaB [Bryobacterales bacterium]|nr:Flp pilus assembly protein CpaB [Bryobacterales bacterium]
MDRRFLTVLGVSLVFALLVSSIFYQMSSRAAVPEKKAEPVDTQDVVVAAKPLSVGVTVKPDDVKVVKVHGSGFPKGAFHKPEEVIDRPVMSNILLDEPILEGRLATRGSGFGLAPIIPVGMRAVSVRVNEVVGVAGFVLPGMHVDVLVTGRPPTEGAATMTTTALQDITVLSAGQTMQADPRGQAINAPVVTLLVTPEQAETLTLAGTESRIQLVLRNGADKAVTSTPGRRIHELYNLKPERPSGSARLADGELEDAPRRPKPRPVAVALAPVVPPPVVAPPSVPDQIVIIRGNQKTVEVVNNVRRGQ